VGADAAPTLADLAKTLPDARLRIRALKGYIRIARQFDMPAAQRVAMCREALAMAGQRPDEQDLVREVMTRNASPEMLALAISYLNDPQVPGMAGVAISIGDKIVGNNPAEVAKAMEPVLQANPRGPLAGRAKALLDQAKAVAK
jgi:hypothetical protein